jgi:Leucine-rich repeat (LRR) protein
MAGQKSSLHRFPVACSSDTTALTSKETDCKVGKVSCLLRQFLKNSRPLPSAWVSPIEFCQSHVSMSTNCTISPIKVSIKSIHAKTGEFDLESCFTLIWKSAGILDAFELRHCINLVHLDLSHNQLKSLDGLGTLIHLKRADFSYNSIANLGTDQTARQRLFTNFSSLVFQFEQAGKA